MIDTSVPGSPGWWLARLSAQLRSEQARLERLRSYYRGDPPLPEGAQNQRSAYRAFQRKSRTNFAELACEAVRDRMTPVGLRTAVQDDRTGDEGAWELWRSMGMDLLLADALENMLSVGAGYLVVGRDDTGPEPVIVATQEDPASFTIETYPDRPRQVRAGLKLVHDPVERAHLAYVYLPGAVWVARRPGAVLRARASVPSFSASGWEWDGDLSADLPKGFEDDVPIFPLLNRSGVGEFERHTDVLDRINHMILQRMMISTAQAFKQRALKGELPEFYPAGHPQAGQVIDYDGIFVADPGALWQLPDGVEIWESSQADISPILLAVRDDVLHFAAVTRTPLAMLSPDSANQTAEGASFAREGLVFRGEDRIMRATDAIRDAMSFAFRLRGDADRAPRERIEVLWAPLERRSLAERADAASKASADMPVHARLTELWQLPPGLARQYAAELAEEKEQESARSALGLSALSGFGPQPRQPDEDDDDGTAGVPARV